MSARMAAATGDLVWEARYHQSEPKLDAAIKETMALAPDDSAYAGSTQTDTANLKLVAMENQAFAFVRDGRPADARAVLFGQAYEEQKALYAGGMTTLLTGARIRVDRSLQQAKQRDTPVDGRVGRPARALDRGLGGSDRQPATDAG